MYRAAEKFAAPSVATPYKGMAYEVERVVNKMKDEFKLLKPLCLVLKQFLAHKGLNNADIMEGSSSYGLILMMVHILSKEIKWKSTVSKISNERGYAYI